MGALVQSMMPGKSSRQDPCDRTSSSDRKRDKSETLTRGPLLKSKI